MLPLRASALTALSVTKASIGSGRGGGGCGVTAPAPAGARTTAATAATAAGTRIARSAEPIWESLSVGAIVPPSVSCRLAERARPRGSCARSVFHFRKT